MSTFEIRQGDALEVLRQMPAESVDSMARARIKGDAPLFNEEVTN